MIDWRSSTRVTYPLIGLILVVIGWWILTSVLAVPSYYLPKPGTVAERLINNYDFYLEHAWHSFEKIAWGGGIGIIAGAGLGLAIRFVPYARSVIFPYIVTLRVLPKLAIAPLLLIYLGTGTRTAVIFVAMIAFFPMVISTAAGLDRAPKPQRELLASVNAGPLRTIAHVYVPYALPDVFAGLKQSVTLAVVGAIVAEWIVADNGLGYLILIGSERLRTDLMFAALFTLLALGIALYGAIVLLQRKVLWRDIDTLLEV